MSQAAGGLQAADVVFLSAGPGEALEAVQRLREAGFNGPILGGDGLDLPDVWQAHAEVSGVFYTTHAYLGADNTDPRVVAFREAYTEAYPGHTPGAFAALGYDTARLLRTALADAEGPDPNAVREAFAGIRQFEGVTGLISYGFGRRCLSPGRGCGRLHRRTCESKRGPKPRRGFTAPEEWR